MHQLTFPSLSATFRFSPLHHFHKLSTHLSQQMVHQAPPPLNSKPLKMRLKEMPEVKAVSWNSSSSWHIAAKYSMQLVFFAQHNCVWHNSCTPVSTSEGEGKRGKLRDRTLHGYLQLWMQLYKFPLPQNRGLPPSKLWPINTPAKIMKHSMAIAQPNVIQNVNQHWPLYTTSTVLYVSLYWDSRYSSHVTETCMCSVPRWVDPPERFTLSLLPQPYSTGVHINIASVYGTIQLLHAEWCDIAVHVQYIKDASS